MATPTKEQLRQRLSVLGIAAPEGASGAELQRLLKAERQRLSEAARANVTALTQPPGEGRPVPPAPAAQRAPEPPRFGTVQEPPPSGPPPFVQTAAVRPETTTGTATLLIQTRVPRPAPRSDHDARPHDPFAGY